MYYKYFSEEIKKATKGIPHRCELSIEEFKQVLYGNETFEHRVDVRSLRLNREKEMTRTLLRKRGLTDIHLKMAVASDKVVCEPLKKRGKFI